MATIYEQHANAFRSVSAFVIMFGDKRVATIALKFPRDGAGRLYAYVHWIGTDMQRGFAAGGGYDKRSAAIAAATRKMPLQAPPHADADIYARFIDALARDDGKHWDDRLWNARFSVYQAA